MKKKDKITEEERTMNTYESISVLEFMVKVGIPVKNNFDENGLIETDNSNE